MASDLLAIARSGTRAARAALDVTAQNIANASSEGYVRRSVELTEVSASTANVAASGTVFAGVRVSGITRNADAFRQAEVRRTGADAARASAEINGLEDIEAAVEQTGVFEASVKFEGSLQQLLADTTSGPLRASVLETGRTLASSLNITAKSLDAAGDAMRFEAQGGVDQVNLLASELAKVNNRLMRSSGSTADQATLLDQRDTLLQKLSEKVDVSTTFSSNNAVEVRLGGSDGATLVSGSTAGKLAMQTAPNGTIGFTLDGAAVTPTAGTLAGTGQALVQLAETHGRIDAVAASVISAVNGAQSSGADLNGAAGEPLFSGTDAASIALAISDPDKIATAPAGSTAKSRDAGNLNVLRKAFAAADPSGGLDKALFNISSAVSGRTLTRDALVAIAGNASTALQSQAGVDLDQEAVNLVRYQQAFQAAGRIMQVSNDIFDTLLGIR